MDGTTGNAPGDWYEIRLDGRLDPRWAALFHGFDLLRGADGSTLLRGRVPDQAALHGVLNQVRDIGLPILSVVQVEIPRPPTPDNPPHHPRRTP